MVKHHADVAALPGRLTRLELVQLVAPVAVTYQLAVDVQPLLQLHPPTRLDRIRPPRGPRTRRLTERLAQPLDRAPDAWLHRHRYTLNPKDKVEHALNKGRFRVARARRPRRPVIDFVWWLRVV